MTAQGHSPLKTVFNVTNRLMAATIAAGARSSGAPRCTTPAWAAAMVAALCFSLLDVVATSTVVSIAEQTPFHDLFVRLAGTGLLATLAAAPIGLVVALAEPRTAHRVLLLPLTVAVACNSRYAVAQRDEHLRFERLYGSLTRSARLLTFEDALAALATEARSLAYRNR